MDIAVLLLKLRWLQKWSKGHRSWDPRRRRTRLAGPLHVEIQTIDRCDAACVMCPYTTLDHSGPPTRMADDLFTRVLHELAAPGTLGSLCLMLQNEPLLDRRLHERVREARQVMGAGVSLVVVTHGALLTRQRFEELRAAGIDRLAVSIDTPDAATYAKIRRGLSFEKVVANTEAVLADRGDVQVMVKFVKQRDNEGEDEKFVRHWNALGAAVKIDRLSNRAGALDEFERLRVPGSRLLRRLAERLLNRLMPCCPLPFTAVSIMADGRVICCANDWGPRDTVGDLGRQSLAEIWNGERLNHYRHLLWSHRTDESLVCRDCSLAKDFWDW